MVHEETSERHTSSGWATGGVMFAATMMVLIGFFQLIIGLAAIFDDQYFVVARGYVFGLDITAWGWIHLTVGVVALVTAFGLFTRMAWAVFTALPLAVLSAVNNFLFVPYAPFWSLVVLGIDAWVIWSLTRPRTRTDEG